MPSRKRLQGKARRAARVRHEDGSTLPQEDLACDHGSKLEQAWLEFDEQQNKNMNEFNRDFNELWRRLMTEETKRVTQEMASKGIVADPADQLVLFSRTALLAMAKNLPEASR